MPMDGPPLVRAPVEEAMDELVGVWLLRFLRDGVLGPGRDPVAADRIS